MDNMAYRYWVGLVITVFVLLIAIYVLSIKQISTIFFAVSFVVIIVIALYFAWINVDVIRHPKAARLHNQGWAKQKQGDIEGAIADYREALRLYPPLSQTYINCGVVQMNKDNFESALAYFKQAIELNNRRTIHLAHYDLGFLYMRQKEFERAISEFSMAIRLKSTFARAYINRSVSYFKLRNLNQSIADSTEVIRLGKPRSMVALAYHNRACVYMRKGDLDTAFFDCNQAIHIDPRLYNAFDCRGQLHILNDNPMQALTDFKKVLKLKPDFAAASAGLAVTQFKLGQIDEAKQLWNQLIARDVNYKDLSWLEEELDWLDPMVDEARKLIATLDANE